MYYCCSVLFHLGLKYLSVNGKKIKLAVGIFQSCGVWAEVTSTHCMSPYYPQSCVTYFTLPFTKLYVYLLKSNRKCRYWYSVSADENTENIILSIVSGQPLS